MFAGYLEVEKGVQLIAKLYRCSWYSRSIVFYVLKPVKNTRKLKKLVLILWG
jgi:hypothetical protein